MKNTGHARNNYERKPRVSMQQSVYGLTPGESLDITIGYGTLKYCTTANGWLLPAGSRQGNRVVRDEAKARNFALRMHEVITRNLSLSSLNSRLIAFGG